MILRGKLRSTRYTTFRHIWSLVSICIVSARCNNKNNYHQGHEQTLKKAAFCSRFMKHSCLEFYVGGCGCLSRWSVAKSSLYCRIDPKISFGSIGCRPFSLRPARPNNIRLGSSAISFDKLDRISRAERGRFNVFAAREADKRGYRKSN